jgi:RNA polymerase sigma-70 factor (sigma-E family)
MSEQIVFADYVAARRDSWVRAACLLTGDAHSAEDLVQTALLRIWPRWQRISARGDADAYVRTVLMNLYLNSLRRRRWHLSTPDPQAYERHRSHAAVPSDEVDALLYLRQVLAEVAPRQRAVLVLRYYFDLSEAETANTLGCSIGTVKSQAAKGAAKLRSSSESARIEAKDERS